MSQRSIWDLLNSNTRMSGVQVNMVSRKGISELSREQKDGRTMEESPYRGKTTWEYASAYPKTVKDSASPMQRPLTAPGSPPKRNCIEKQTVDQNGHEIFLEYSYFCLKLFITPSPKSTQFYFSLLKPHKTLIFFIQGTTHLLHQFL